MNPFLSIVIIFCDNDVHYIPGLLKQIEEKVFVSYEVVLISNCTYHLADFNAKNVRMYQRGYNAYQFDSRRFAIPYCTGKYIWYIDADDSILTITPLLEKMDDDIVIFCFMEQNKILSVPTATKRIIGRLDGKKIKRYSSEILQVENPKNFLGFICCTLWNKWIKKELADELYPQLPAGLEIVASEDVFYTSYYIDRSKTICLCAETIYIYNKENAKGFDPKMTNQRFEHIIKGRKESLELFNHFIKDPEHYEPIQQSICYFYIKLLETEDPKSAFETMKKHFKLEDLKASLNSPLLSAEDKKKLTTIVY